MEPKEFVVEVKTELYSLEAIYKACYHFLEKFYIRLEGDSQGTIEIHARAKSKEDVSTKDIAGEIENELLHQVLRLKVSNANQKIREYVITQALSSAEGAAASVPQLEGLPGPDLNATPSSAVPSSPVLDEELEKEIEKLLAEVEKSNPTDDPLKITTPWEEKNASPKEPGSKAEKK